MDMVPDKGGGDDRSTPTHLNATFQPHPSDSLSSGVMYPPSTGFMNSQLVLLQAQIAAYQMLSRGQTLPPQLVIPVSDNTANAYHIGRNVLMTPCMNNIVGCTNSNLFPLTSNPSNSWHIPGSHSW